MKISVLFKRYKDTFIVWPIFILAVALIAWRLPIYDRNVVDGEIKSRIINAKYYLDDAAVTGRQEIRATKNSVDAEITYHISPQKAHDMVAQDHILVGCTTYPLQCSKKTWQPFSYYVTSYGKTYAKTNYNGTNELRNYNPALPNLTDRDDMDDFSCTMRQLEIDSAYGLCVNPNSGELLYHYYKNWQQVL